MTEEEGANRFDCRIYVLSLPYRFVWSWLLTFYVVV